MGSEQSSSQIANLVNFGFLIRRIFRAINWLAET